MTSNNFRRTCDATRPSPRGTFHSGAFHLGEQVDRPVEDEVYACEHHLLGYLAAATAGQRVAVGTLCCQVPMTDDEYARQYPGLSPKGVEANWHFEVPLIFVPAVGIWIVEPVFRSLRDAHERAEKGLTVLASRLGVERDELGVNLALIAMEPGAVDMRGVDLADYFDTSVYEDVTETLGRRAPSPSVDVDNLVDVLLETGSWIDAKDGLYDDWEIPCWLAEMIARQT